MNKSKVEAMVAQLMANAVGLRYGSIAVSAKLHDGRVVEVSYLKTEQTREREAISGTTGLNRYESAK